MSWSSVVRTDARRFVEYLAGVAGPGDNTGGLIIMRSSFFKDMLCVLGLRTGVSKAIGAELVVRSGGGSSDFASAASKLRVRADLFGEKGESGAWVVKHDHEVD